MSGILESVDQRTKLVGENRLELLLFRLAEEQLYGINVFKVKEVLQCPKLTELPKRHPVVRGVAHIRGTTLAVMDLNLAVLHTPLENIDECFVIMAEYNRTLQGFLVSAVERIVNLNWEDIHSPPKGSGRSNYLTAVTEYEGKIIEIIDVEKVLSQVAPTNDELPDNLVSESEIDEVRKHDYKIMVVDDSSVARKQVARCCERLGVHVDTFDNGQEALNHLLKLHENGVNAVHEYLMLISDVEMPEMDGYTLVSTLRSYPFFGGFYIVLHTSLSGVFNEVMVEKAGADDFLAKFKPEELASRLSKRIEDVSGIHMMDEYKE